MTGDRSAFGLTSADITRELADLGDDHPGERLDLGRALAGWADAARAHLPGPHPVDINLTLVTQGGSRPVGLSNALGDRLVHLLNVDTSLITAHTAATRLS